MAKITKEKPEGVIDESITHKPNTVVSEPGETIEPLTDTVKSIPDPQKKEVSKDVPIDLTEKEVSKPPVVATQILEERKPESEKKGTDEVTFLKRLLQIQSEGGFGRHLDQIINDRIKELS